MHRISVFILSLATAAPAGAVTLTLERAPGYALAHNPTLVAARLRIEEARGRLLGAGRLANPEIQIDAVQNVRVPERSVAIAFIQRFPVTARLRFEKAVSEAQFAVAEAEVRDAERRLAAAARAAAVEILALRAHRELRRQQLANSRDQMEFVARRVAAGEASSIEVAQCDLEGEQLVVEMLRLDSTHAALVGDLRLLLGVDAGEAVEISGALPGPVALPADGADGAQRPDLAAARSTVDAARQSIGLAKARKWEDVGVGIAASGERIEDVPVGFVSDSFLGLKLSVPLPIWNRNEGGIALATATAARARQEADALAFRIRNEARTARAEMAALATLVGQMEAGLLPRAVQVEGQLRAAYDAGQTPLTEVLRARARRLELSQRRVDALRDYHLARVRYEAALGHPTISSQP